MRRLLTDAVQTTEVAFDADLPWQKARSVALRPEPFGALLYHFGNRKLSFLKSRTLVAVVETLAEHPSADATLAACGVPDAQLPAYRRALADLARSHMIEKRTSLPPAARGGTPSSSPLTGSERASGRGPCDEADPEAHP